MDNNDYDLCCRIVAQSDAEGFFRWLMPRARLRFEHWIDTRQIPWPGEPNRTCDTVASLVDEVQPAHPWAFVAEFQVKPSSQMFGRALGYLAAVWMSVRHSEEKGMTYQLAISVVNLTGTNQSYPASRDFQVPGSEPIGLRLDVCERYLSIESAEATMADIESGKTTWSLLAWIPLMRGGGQKDIIERWQRQVEKLPNPDRRSEMTILTASFAHLGRQKPAWSKTLEIMMKRLTSPVLDRFRAEGRADAIVNFLAARFGPVSDGLSTQIRSAAPARLGEWIRLAARAGSLDEFRQQAGL